jgi:hypothetical protein
MATPTEIKNRLVTLWGHVSGITTAVDDYPNDDLPFEAAELPAVVIRLVSTQLGAVTVTRTPYAGGIIRERWTIPAVLHVGVVSKMDALAPNTTEMEACEPFLRSPAVFFANSTRLGYVDFVTPANNLTDLVYDSEPLSNTGILKIERPKVSYWGLLYTHTILEEFYYE